MVTVTDDILAANCNLFVISLVGTNEFTTELAAFVTANSLTEDQSTAMATYTDGYHITAS
jgi:hypothetical protein